MRLNREEENIALGYISLVPFTAGRYLSGRGGERFLFLFWRFFRIV